jgi:hypothetical protein
LIDIAFDSNGQLYGTGPNNLYAINKLTGGATLIGGTISSLFITFDASNILYGANSTSNILYTIDTVTAVSNVKGSLPGVSGVVALGWKNGLLYAIANMGGNEYLISVEVDPLLPGILDMIVGGQIFTGEARGLSSSPNTSLSTVWSYDGIENIAEVDMDGMLSTQFTLSPSIGGYFGLAFDPNV